VPRSHRQEPKGSERSRRCSTCKRQPHRCAQTTVDPPDFTQITEGAEAFELVVPATVTDRSGTEVVHADITTWVTPIG
jgi:hypothetical protein